MSAVAVLPALVLLLLAPLAVAAVRQRTLVAMAVRSIRRRRAEAILVVAGALLGTAIITSSFVVGDVIEGSLTDVARTRYGPIDITIAPAGDTGLDEVTAAVEAAGLPNIDGLLSATIGTATLEAPPVGHGSPAGPRHRARPRRGPRVRLGPRDHRAG